MKSTLALLIASTALTAAIGLPASSAILDLAGRDPGLIAAGTASGQDMPAAILARNDDDDDDDSRRSRRGDDHDDDDDNRRQSGRDDDDDDDDDDCDDDDRGCRGSARAPAPAGVVAPPQNGLFGTATPPQVRVE